MKLEDLYSVLAEDLNKDERWWMDDATAEYMVKGAFSVSIFYKNQLMLCGGVLPYWFNRGQIWTMFSAKSKDHFVAVFRSIKRYLEYQPFRRVELSIPCDFAVGRRRAELLGFKLEVEAAEKFLPDGRNASLYSYVRADS